MKPNKKSLWVYISILAMSIAWVLLDTFFGGVQPNPRTLPPAYINETYDVEIDISNMLINDSFQSSISDANFKLIPEQRNAGNDIYGKPNIYYSYRTVHLVGTPTDLTPIKIVLKGSIRGSMFSNIRDFNKEYTLEVKKR